MSRLLTRKDVESVVEALSPAIEAFLERFAEGQNLAVVILDPATTSMPRLLYRKEFGNPETWEHDYYNIAFGKAALCFREKCDSEEVKNERPFRYCVGDPPFAGGVYVEGLVVACSGVEGYFDQMFARWIAACCRAIATHRLEKEVIARNLSAIPEGFCA